jgi:hypothetical protein
MERETLQLTITNVLLAIVVLNTLGQAPTRAFQTASFLAAYAVFFYAAYLFVSPHLGKLKAS